MQTDTSAGEDCWIGIDLGTQSVRALAVTTTGRVLGSGRHPLDSVRDGARHEQDPRQWWSAVAAACSQATADLRGTIRGVAVDATSGTILLAGRNGHPFTPGLMYDDTRAAAETERVNDLGRDLWKRLGYQKMQSSWGLPKALWLLENTPLKTPARVLHQSDFINQMLTGGTVASDISNSLKTGCDLLTGTWPQDLMTSLGIQEESLPELTLSGTVLGHVSPSAADATGIPAGTEVIAGMTDGCAAQLGSGALTAGAWNSVIGTTLVLKGSTPDLLHDPSGVVYSHRSPDGGWLPGGASGTGAGYITRELPGRDLDALSDETPRHTPSDTVVYPLASSKGERFPFVAPDASAFRLGLPSNDAELYAALVQGIAFVERLAFDHLHSLGAPTDGPLVLTGGASRSRHWSQLRADILGRPVTLVDNSEPALGMAILAASAGGSVADTATAMVNVREVIDPQPGATRKYMEPYLRLVSELRARCWLGNTLAAHATDNAQKAAAG
ncbi:FGGY-family carbohydrate kinase [Pseudarthrobacter sp. 1C304]|uniref:FGGY-family carbohydrate kinase n=1 Tax=Pseudarthrobacter sp. 1C304 TaxID=3457438 RepID=UPI003FD32DC7